MTPSRLAIDDQNPWPGLAAFDEAAERFFNGRRNEIAELRRLVLQCPLTVLFGASGLGKTSLVQAGLFPVLRNDAMLPVYVRLDVRDTDAPLIEQITQALRKEILLQRVDGPAIGPGESLWHYLHRDGLELWSAQNKLLTPLFVLDQFEEVFTLGADNRDGVARLRRDLADLLENRLPAAVTDAAHHNGGSQVELSFDSQRYKVILSFREDFLPALEGWKRELPSVTRNRFRLLPMTGEQAFEAVHTTAPQLADAAIARDIVRFVAAAQEADGAAASGEGMHELAVEPALLSLVCHGLNERRKAHGKAAFDQALLKQGGFSIISNYYEESVRGLPDRVQRFIEKELITERGYRKPCDIDDARTAYGVTEQEIGALVDRRLLRVEPQHGVTRVELTHDLLTRVVREHRERQRLRERTRRQRRRMAVLTGSGVVLGALVVMFFLLYRAADGQRRLAEMQTRVATAQRLASQSRAALARFPQRSVLLAVEAVYHSLRANEPIVADADQSLREALATAGGFGFGGAGARISSIQASPDGRRLAIILDETIYVSDLSAAPPVALTLLGHLTPAATRNENYPPQVSFSADGRFLVAMALGSAPQVWALSAASAGPLKLTAPPDAAPLATTISADGRWLVGLAKEMTLVLWDLSTSDGVPTPVVLKFDESLKLVDRANKPLPGKSSANKEVLQAAVTGMMGLARITGADPEQHTIVLDYLRLSTESPDGRWLVRAEDIGGEMRLIDQRAANPAAAALVLPDDIGSVPTVVFSANSRRLAIIGYTGLTRVWDLASPPASLRPVEIPRRSTDETAVGAAAFSPDGKWLLTAALVNRLDPNRRPGTAAWLWNLEQPGPSEHPLELSGHEAGVSAIAITGDGRWAVTTSNAGVVRLWSLADEDPASSPLVLRGHERGVHDISVTSDNHWLITASDAGSARVFDLRAPQPAAMPLQIAAPGTIEGVTMSPDGRWLATGGTGDGGHLWDLSIPAPAISPVVLPNAGAVPHTGSFWFSADMHWVVAAGEYEPARLFDMRADRIADRGRALDRGDGPIARLAISADSRWLAMTRGYSNDQTRLWDLVHPQPDFAPIVLRGALLAVSGDSRSLVTAGAQGIGLVWDLTTPDPSKAAIELTGHAKGISACYYTPDGRWLITASDDRVQVWDRRSSGRPWKAARAFDGPGNRGDRLFGSPDGRWIVTGGDELQLIDLQSPTPAAASHRLPKEYTSYPGPLVSFTPDSRWLITTVGKTAQLWNLRGADPAAKAFVLSGHEPGVGALAISPDSRWLVTSGVGGTGAAGQSILRLWNLTSPDPSSSPLLLLGHEQGVPYMTIAPDSRWLITGSDDATLRFWDLQAENPTSTTLVIPAYSKVTSLRITPDGRFVVSTGADGLIRLWHLRLTDLLSLAQTVSGRNLSRDEWQLFFQGQPYRKTFDGLPEPRVPK